jgi:Uma2 family endonuclease
MGLIVRTLTTVGERHAMSQVQAEPKRRHLYRLTLRQFETMIGAGVFGDERVELLNGIMVAKMTTYHPHIYAVAALGELLRGVLPQTNWWVLEEKPIRLGSASRPEPDIAIVRGARTEYARRPPTEHDIALLVEVSDSSYAEDTDRKRRLYERFGVPEYWVLDLKNRQVEVFTLEQRIFGPSLVYTEADEVPVTLDGRAYGRIAVSALLTPLPPPAPEPAPAPPPGP